MDFSHTMKAAFLREKDGSNNPVYAAGKGTTARVETPVAAGDTSLLTAVDQIISMKLGIPKQENVPIPIINAGMLGKLNESKKVDNKEETEVKMLLQTDNFIKLLTTLPNGSTATDVSPGIVDSFMWHTEKSATAADALDLVGCYPTKLMIEIPEEGAITQTLNFKSRKGVVSVIVTNLAAASTATKMVRSNLTVYTVGGKTIADLGITKATITIELEWNEPYIVNNDFLHEATLKGIKYIYEFDYTIPNDATYANTWEALMLSNTLKEDVTIATTIGTLWVKSMTNCVLKSANQSDFTNQGLRKHTARFESGPATVIS